MSQAGVPSPDRPRAGARRRGRGHSRRPATCGSSPSAADFWVACAGGASLLVAMGLALLLLGDRQLSAADLLLSELHLGATYDAVWRRRLWRRMPFDVFVVPLAILVATYALAMSDRPLILHHRHPLPGRLASGPPEPRDRALLPAARGRAAVQLAPLALLGGHLHADGGLRRLLHEHRADARGRAVLWSGGGRAGARDASGAWRSGASSPTSRGPPGGRTGPG